MPDSNYIDIIGKAGHAVSPSVKEALPSIPWQLLYGLRHRLICDDGDPNCGIFSVQTVLSAFHLIVAEFRRNSLPAQQ